MHFVLDENAPVTLVEPLRNFGAEVSRITDYIAEGSPDPLVAATCDELGAIVISVDSDFKRIITRRRDRQKRPLRHVGLIKMSCKESRVVERLMAAMPLIYKEYELRQQMPDRRIIAFVHTEIMTIHR